MTRWFKLFLLLFIRVYLIRFKLIDGISSELKYRFFKPLLHHRQLIRGTRIQTKKRLQRWMLTFCNVHCDCLEFTKMFMIFPTKKSFYFSLVLISVYVFSLTILRKSKCCFSHGSKCRHPISIRLQQHTFRQQLIFVPADNLRKCNASAENKKPTVKAFLW